MEGTLQSRLRSSMLFLLLLALVLLVVWARAGDEASLWIDEIHSLQLSQLPLDRLLDESARDFHPPAYSLTLKLWLKVGRLTGFEPGLAWARALNVVVWLAVAAIIWLLGARALGRREGMLLTLCVVGSAGAAVVVGDVRGYAVAYGSLSVAVLLLSVLCGDSLPRRWRPRFWTAYGLTLAVAVWSHLLAAVPVALLGVTWLLTVLTVRRGDPSARIVPGAVAHFVPWFLFTPWLIQVPAQLAHLERVGSDWMTPASAANLLRVFTWWLPFGRIGVPSWWQAESWLLLLGALSVTVPVGVWLWGGGVRRSSTPANTLAWLALPTAAGSVATFWLLARLDVAATFHGPRYPLLVGGIFAAGLVGAAVAGTRRFAHACAVLLFWILAAFVGHVQALRQAALPGGLAAFRPRIEELATGGGPIHVMPSEMSPFIRTTFSSVDLRPIEELACSPPDDAIVLDVNPWPALDRPRDLVIAHAIVSGRLAAGVQRHDFSDAQTSATLYRLEEVDREVAEELCRTGFRPGRAAPPTAVATAAAEDQLAGQGWSYLEFDGLDARRWGTRREVRIHFDRVVPAGTYTLHLMGARQPQPHEVVELALTMEEASLDVVVPVGSGAIDLAFPVTLRRSDRPVLRVGHPTWSPAKATGSGDERRLSFLFDVAWMIPAGPGGAQSSRSARSEAVAGVWAYSPSRPGSLALIDPLPIFLGAGTLAR